MPRVRLTLIVCLAVLLTARPAVTQTRATSGDLTGTVFDQSKAVLPGVEVTVVNVDTGLVRTAITDGEGRYGLPALPPGTYTVRTVLDGFISQHRTDVVVLVGAAVDLPFILTLAGTTVEVTVTAEHPLVDTLNTAVATTLSRQQIENLPINGRNFISFALITPAVTTDRMPQQGAAATSGLTFAGQHARSNNITVDGVDNNDAALGAVRATFSQEAVREFQVLTNSYSAEFGKASGGVVNIVTKSGTNRFGGNLFGYFRDDVLNAKERFEKFDPSGSAIDRTKAPYGQKQYGFTVGGPIRRDKSFYFVSFERLDLHANNFVNIDDRTVVMLGSTPLGTAKQILERAGFAVETGNVPYSASGNQFLAKGDHQFTATQRLSVRFNHGDAYNEDVEPWGGQVARSRGGALHSTDNMLAASHTLVHGPHFVNELRFQYARRDQVVNSLDPRCGGPCVGINQGGPTLDVTCVAFVGRQRFTPQARHSRRWQIADTMSRDVRSHQFKVGGDANWIDNVNETVPLQFGGRFIFAASIPGSLVGLPDRAISSIQAVALGLPSAYAQGYGNPFISYRVSDLSLFAQDDWRVTPNLTVKLGARYQDQYWPEVRYAVRGFAPYSFPSDHNNIAPRLAFAWDPSKQKSTSIHGAYGIFYDNHITVISQLTAVIDGMSNVRTFVAQLPNPLVTAAWNAPQRRLPEPPPGLYPSVSIVIDPRLRTPSAQHVSFGIDRQLARDLSISANAIYAHGTGQLGTIDFNPILPVSLGPGRRPADINGQAGTSASMLQYESFGQTWYRALVLSLSKRLASGAQLLASYTLAKAEDNTTDFQSTFLPQDNGSGRNPQDPAGLPRGFDPDSEKGPSVEDQRHRLVVSGAVPLRGGFLVSSIVTVASGRPFNVLAGTDLNGDGNGGAFPPDRARTDPADPSSSVIRNIGVMPAQATVDLRASRRMRLRGRVAVDAIVEVFNLFNRTNYTEINNIFGIEAYPSQPLPTYGQFTQAAAPRQVQLAVKALF